MMTEQSVEQLWLGTRPANIAHIMRQVVYPCITLPTPYYPLLLDNPPGMSLWHLLGLSTCPTPCSCPCPCQGAGVSQDRAEVPC